MSDRKEEITMRLRALKLAPERELEIVEEMSQRLDDRYKELIKSGESNAVRAIRDPELPAIARSRVSSGGG